MEKIKSVDELITNWGHKAFDYLPNVFFALLVLFLFYVLGRFFRKYSLHFYTKAFGKAHDIARLISTVIYIFFLISGAFIALEILGLESFLAKLLAGAGIIGIVAGFAFKDIASNAFAGLFLNAQKPFVAGDWVKIDNHFGTIADIGWITTAIKTVTGQKIYVPNQLIYNNSFINYSTFKKRRVVLSSGVSYGDDLEHVKQVALDEVQKITALLKDEAVDFYFTEIGSSSYNFEVRFWIKFQQQKDFLEAQSEAIMRIKKRFEAEDISLAYSVMTLDFGVKGGVNIFDQPLQIRK